MNYDVKIIEESHSFNPHFEEETAEENYYFDSNVEENHSFAPAFEENPVDGSLSIDDVVIVRGKDGFSPIVSIQKVGKVTTIVITDKRGDHVAEILDGREDTISQEEIDKAVEKYLDENPVDVGVNFTPGNALELTEDGVLNVLTVEEVEVDNTKPITSAAVAATVGNIEILLKTI